MTKFIHTDFTEEEKQNISTKISNKVKGQLWYTNGIKDIRQTIDKEIPVGYYLGRTSNRK